VNETTTDFRLKTQGQVTPIAMTNIGWKFYYVFIVCNLTNALFFWAFLPETAKRPLEGKPFHPQSMRLP
jgi:hypothetical protein